MASTLPDDTARQSATDGRHRQCEYRIAGDYIIQMHGKSQVRVESCGRFHRNARSYKLGMIGSTIKDQGTQLALSPDGSLLAILYDESIYLFHLPPIVSVAH